MPAVILLVALVAVIGVRLAGRGTRTEPGGEITAVCERVVDGDTIKLIGGERVRYTGIDTPETVHPNKPVEPFGRAASDYNRELVEGRRVRIELDVQERDRFGRLLGYVYVRGDGGELFVNAELVRAGFARVSTHPPNVRHAEDFLKLEREARDQQRGLWSPVDDGPD